MSNGLEVRSLTAGYNDVHVIKNVNLHVGAGDSIVITGPNGCGKSTLLRAVAGFARVHHGSITFGECVLVGKRPWQLVTEGIVYSRQAGSVFSAFTVAENIRTVFRFADRGHRFDEAEVLRAFPLLAEKWRVLAGNLSGGERQILSVARALMLRPRLLLLDEPLSGLAMATAKGLVATLAQFRVRLGFTTLIVEHASALDFYGDCRRATMAYGGVMRDST